MMKSKIQRILSYVLFLALSCVSLCSCSTKGRVVDNASLEALRYESNVILAYADNRKHPALKKIKEVSTSLEEQAKKSEVVVFLLAPRSVEVLFSDFESDGSTFEIVDVLDLDEKEFQLVFLNKNGLEIFRSSHEVSLEKLFQLAQGQMFED